MSGGDSPPGPSLRYPIRNSGGVGEWLKPPGCKLGALTGYAGSNPAPATRLVDNRVYRLDTRGWTILLQLLDPSLQN